MIRFVPRDMSDEEYKNSTKKYTSSKNDFALSGAFVSKDHPILTMAGNAALLPVSLAMGNPVLVGLNAGGIGLGLAGTVKNLINKNKESSPKYSNIQYASSVYQNRDDMSSNDFATVKSGPYTTDTKTGLTTTKLPNGRNLVVSRDSLKKDGGPAAEFHIGLKDTAREKSGDSSQKDLVRM